MVHVACMGKMRNVYKILVGKQTLERHFGSPEHEPRGNYNDLKGTSCRDVKSGPNWHMTASNDGTVMVINLTTIARNSTVKSSASMGHEGSSTTFTRLQNKNHFNIVFLSIAKSSQNGLMP